MQLMLPDGFEWNQAELEPRHEFNNALVSIVAFDDRRIPRPIGTGFILAVLPECAIGCTAAHNFSELRRIQSPKKWHHPSALKQFLPSAKPLDLNRKGVRAMCIAGNQVEMAIFGWVAWDEASDIAFFSLVPQDRTSSDAFTAKLDLDNYDPQIGAEIVALGYKDMSVENDTRDGSGADKFDFQRQLIMRGGRITAVHPQGHRLCNGPCVETSIPVFPGMSGGRPSDSHRMPRRSYEAVWPNIFRSV